MKFIYDNGKFALNATSCGVRNNLHELMAAMGIRGYPSLCAPEQGVILHLLIEQGKQGLSTREIADLCGMSIYKVRHLLLPLEEKGYVLRSKIIKHHRWFISKDFINIE